MNRVFAVNTKNGRIMINPDGIKTILASKKKTEEKKGFRVLTKNRTK